MNQPLGVSSTTQIFSRPRCLMNSVSVVHFVLFMCTCVLFAMYSLYTTFAATRELRWETAIRARKSRWKSALYPAMNLPWFCPKMAICRRCASLVWWHLNPFSSRHCLEHTWHQNRSF